MISSSYSVVLFSVLVLKSYSTDSFTTLSKLRDVSIDNATFKRVKDLHFNWYMFSIKALLAQLGKELLRNIDTVDRHHFLKCLDGIKENKEVEKSARCLVKTKIRQLSKIAKRRSHKESFIKPRYINYKHVKKSWRRRRLKRGVHRLVLPRSLSTRKTSSSATVPSMLDRKTRSPVKRITNLFTSLFSPPERNATRNTWKETKRKMKKIQRQMEANEKSEGARVYSQRMFDLVLDRKNVEPVSDSSVPMLREVFRLVRSLGLGDETTARILSPRIAPLFPEKKRRSPVLSPTILPFYKDESENQILPIPELMNKSGLSSSDQESVMEMIMEVSGARKTTENAMKVLHQLESSGITDSLFKATENVKETFAKVRKSLEMKQKLALSSRGFAFLEKHQMKILLEKHGLNHRLNDFADYFNMTNSERESSLWSAVETISRGKRSRFKRQLPISVLKPLVLEPYAFAPVFGFSLLGPTLLSPNIWSPLILNPALLSPWVLSPAVPLPFIISPYVLSPYVLSPLVMAPFILTPYVLSPNVINPYILSPLILSPYVLCPDVISPMVLGGPILSPSVLSPSVFSKSYLMANVLSPSILS